MPSLAKPRDQRKVNSPLPLPPLWAGHGAQQLPVLRKTSWAGAENPAKFIASNKSKKSVSNITSLNRKSIVEMRMVLFYCCWALHIHCNVPFNHSSFEATGPSHKKVTWCGMCPVSNLGICSERGESARHRLNQHIGPLRSGLFHPHPNMAKNETVSYCQGYSKFNSLTFCFAYLPPINFNWTYHIHLDNQTTTRWQRNKVRRAKRQCYCWYTVYILLIVDGSTPAPVDEK